jgi:hypothetical protein
MAESLPGTHRSINGELVQALSIIDRGSLTQFILTAREVSTHYKWLLAAADDGNWKVWVHQYKAHRDAAGAYADVPHNHRYDFVSLMLAGGYEHVEYAADDTNALRVVSRRRVTAGEVVTAEHTTVHSLANTQPGTISLFVQGSIRTMTSLSYPPTGGARSHTALEEVVDNLRSELAIAGNLGSTTHA